MPRPHWSTVPCKLYGNGARYSTVYNPNGSRKRKLKDGSIVHLKGSWKGAHRASWEEAYGPIPEGKRVLHYCDVKQCIEPLHLWLGSPVDNQQDMAKKGRSLYGSRNPNAQLTETQVIAIRSDSRTQREIAREYYITQGTVSKIKSGKRWNFNA